MTTWSLIFSNSSQKCYVARICWLPEWYTWFLKNSSPITIHQLISLTHSISVPCLELIRVQIHLMAIVAPLTLGGKIFPIRSNQILDLIYLRFLRHAKPPKFHRLRKLTRLIAFSHKNTKALIWCLHKERHVSYVIQ